MPRVSFLHIWLPSFHTMYWRQKQASFCWRTQICHLSCPLRPQALLQWEEEVNDSRPQHGWDTWRCLPNTRHFKWVNISCKNCQQWNLVAFSDRALAQEHQELMGNLVNFNRAMVTTKMWCLRAVSFSGGEFLKDDIYIVLFPRYQCQIKISGCWVDLRLVTMETLTRLASWLRLNCINFIRGKMLSQVQGLISDVCYVSSN